MAGSKTARGSLSTKGSGRAWAVSGAGFLGQMTAVTAFSGFSFVISGMAEDFGVTVAALAICSSTFQLCYRGFAFVWGWIADNFGLRKTLAVAGMGGSVAYACFGLFSADIWSACILYGLTGALFSGLTTPTIAKIVASWYSSKFRGKGTFIITIGGTICGVLLGIVMPIMIEASGWRGSLVGLGIFGFVSSLILFLVIRDKPADEGTVPFGSTVEEYEKVLEAEGYWDEAKTPEQIQEEKRQRRLKLIACLKLPNVWKMGVLIIMINLFQTANSTYLIASISGVGIVLASAGLAKSMQSLGQGIGQFFFGSLCDIFARKYVLSFMLCMCGISYVPAFFALSSGNEVAIVFCVALVGFFNGVVSVYNVILAESFPLALRAVGPGVCSTIGMVGTYGGPLLAAAIITSFGGGAVLAYMPYCAVVAFIGGIYAFFVCPKTGGRKWGDPIADAEVAEMKEEKATAA